MKQILLLISVATFVGCTAQEKSITWSHPSYPQTSEQEKNIAKYAMNKDWSSCNKLAHNKVPRPAQANKARVYTPPPITSNSGGIDYNSYTRGVKAANRSDPFRVYQNNLKYAFYHCVLSRGWKFAQ